MITNVAVIVLAKLVTDLRIITTLMIIEIIQISIILNITKSIITRLLIITIMVLILTILATSKNFIITIAINPTIFMLNYTTPDNNLASRLMLFLLTLILIFIF